MRLLILPTALLFLPSCVVAIGNEGGDEFEAEFGQTEFESQAVIRLAEDGTLRLRGVTVSPDALARSLPTKTRDGMVVLVVEGAASEAMIAEATAALRRAGHEDVLLTTED